MSNPLAGWNQKRADIPARLKALLQDMVRAQDCGYAVFEELERAFYGTSFIASMCVETDIERSRMVHAGEDVYKRPDGEDKNFMLGLEPYPFKSSKE